MARERYLVNAGEETINSAPIALKTKQEKRKNHWDYNKWYYIGTAITAVILFFVIRSFVMRVNPDYQIALMTQEQYPEVFTGQLEDYITRYGEDINGDGKIKVQFNNYQLYTGAAADGKDPNTVMAETAKFSGDTMLGTSMIFMTDDKSLESIKEMNDNSYNFFLDLSSYKKTDSGDKEKIRIKFTSCKGLQGFEPTVDVKTDGDETAEEVTEEIRDLYFNDLYLSLRVVDGTKIEGDEKAKAYFEASKKLFERLRTGN